MTRQRPRRLYADGSGTRFWWVRHAPVPGMRGTIVSHQDLPCDLSDAELVEGLAARIPVEAMVVSSPLRRAAETALAVMKRRPDRLDPRLMEQNFGAWIGRRWAELEQEAAELGFWADPARNRPPGGESFADQVARVASFIATAREDWPGRDVACFCHAGTIRAALALAVSATESGLGFVIDNLSLTRTDVSDGGTRIAMVNWTARA